MKPGRVVMVALLLVSLAATAATAVLARGDPAVEQPVSHREDGNSDGYILTGHFVQQERGEQALPASSSGLRLAWSQLDHAAAPARSIPAAAQAPIRTYPVTPAAFMRNLASSNLTMTSDIGLRWKANVSEEAGFYIARPPDWDGQSPVKVTLYFALGGSSAGAINWRLKLNTYQPGSGEWLTNPGSRNADALLTFPSGPSWYRVYSQTFTLDAANLNEPLWSFFFLRGSGANSETFTGDLYVLGAEVAYQATP